MKKFDVKKFIKTLVILVIVAAIGVGGYFAYKHFTTTSDVPDNGQEVVGANITANPEHFDVWNGETATSFAKGTGTQKDPYQISTGAELAYFASLINNADETYKQAYYCLVNSIDLNGQEWTQIGYSSYGSNSGINKHFSDVHCFSGVFEGKGCVIKNFKITSTNKQMVGFFGDLNGGTIQNLGLENFTFSASNNTTKVYYVGGIVGYNRNGGKVSNCYTASDVRFTATTDDVYVGGIVGCNSTDSTIEYCYSIGNVSAIYRAKSSYGYSNTASANAGGIAAINSGNITNCYAKGNISAYADDGDFIRAGGIVAMNSSVGSSTTSYKYGKVTNCYAIGNISGTGVGQTYVGGLMGANLSSADVENCFATGDVYANGGSKYYVCAGGLLGISDTTNIINCYRLDGQKVVAVGADEEYCTLGVLATLSDLKSETFQGTILNYGSTWSISNGTFPNISGLPQTATIFYGENRSSFILNKQFSLSVENKTGYDFTGWAVDDSYITDNSGAKLSSWNLTGDVIAIAKYDPIEYKAEFYANGTLIDTVVFTVETQNITEPEIPAIKGYNGVWEEYSIKAEDIRVDAVYSLEEYTIDYFGTDEIVNNNPTSYNLNSESIELMDVEKVGYTFDGWYTEESFTNKITSISSGSAGNLSLYAKFTINQYTITFDTKGGNDIAPITQDFGTTVVEPLPLRDGYEFKGWYVKGTNNPYKFSTMPAEDIELEALWSGANIYSIEYILDSGSNNESNPISYTVEDKITLNDATRIGYTFDGWYDANDQKVSEIAKGSTGNLVLTAKWSIANYTITYENTKDAHNNNTASYTINNDTIILLDIEKAGYTFDGWYNSDNEKVTEITAGSYGDVVLSAHWTPIDYTIEYLETNSAINSNPITYNADSDNIILNSISIPGYNFDGWYDANGQRITEITKGSTGNLVLTAKWSIANYTITYENTKDAHNNNAISYTVNSETMILLDIEKAGYTFDGWYNSDNEKVTEITTGSYGDIVLSAHWTPIVYTIEYLNTKNADNPNPTSYTVESGKIILASIEVPGYTFDGWYDIDGVITEIPEGYIGNITLMAYWTANEYTISFVSNGGSSVEPITQDCGTVITAPEKPTRDGYSFVGWYESSTATEPFVFSTMPTSDTILYAKWVVYSLGAIEYDSTVTGVSYYKALNAEAFNATCVDTDGESVLVTLSYTGTFEIGGTITCRLVATKNGLTKQATINNVKVYGNPELSYNSSVEYFNLKDGLTANWFSAIGTDTFGVSTTVNVYVDGEYEAGDVVTVTIETIDVAGNKTSAQIENVKVYGEPIITTNGKTAFKYTDEITLDALGITATDSFGEVLDAEMSWNIEYDKIKGFVDGDVYTYTTTTDYDYVYFTALATETYTLYYKNGASGDRTYIYVYCSTDDKVIKNQSYYSNYSSYSSMTFSVEAGKEYYIRTCAYSLSYTTEFSMYLESTNQKSQLTRLTEEFIGDTVIVTVNAKDRYGNAKTMTVNVDIHGTPIIDEPKRTEFKVDESISIDKIEIEAFDSFGIMLPVQLELKSGEQIAGHELVYIASTVDKAGNTAEKEFVVYIYGAPEITYDRQGVSVQEDATQNTYGYYVTFNLNGKAANRPNTQIITAGNSIEYPEIPLSHGYIFTGWYTTANCDTLYDFSSEITDNIELFAGWVQSASSYYSINTIDVYNNYNTSDTAYAISTSGTSSSSCIYTYFTALQSGTYKLYYRNGSYGSSYGTYVYVYNVTSGSTIRSNTNVYSTSYSSISMELEAGDVICIRNYRYNTSYSSNFYMYVTGPSFPCSVGVADTNGYLIFSGADTVLNAEAYDSFGNKINVFAEVWTGELEEGRYITYKLTATDKLGNVQTILTDPIGVYDGGSIDFDYAALASSLIKLNSKGEEFFATATDSFGNACKVIVIRADGKPLSAGETTDIYLRAIDAAGNYQDSELISNIQVYGTPKIVLNQNDFSLKSDTDTSLLFSVYDSYGKELFPTINIINQDGLAIITVTAEDDAGNVVNETYRFTYIEENSIYVELYHNNALYKTMIVSDKNSFQLPVIEDSDLIFYGWVDVNNTYYTNAEGVGVLELDSHNKFYSVTCSTIYSGYTPIVNTEDLINIEQNGKYVLLRDIDFDNQEWNGINNFAGVLNGNKHVVKNFIINSTGNYVGFIANNSGEISNLGLENFTISCNASNDLYGGGLVGYNSGTIQNCFVNGTIELKTSGDKCYGGGLVGYNYKGTITNCYALGSISTKPYTTSYCGGLIGYDNYGVVNKSYASNTVQASYSYGGGLIGYEYYGTVMDCYATGNVNATGYTGCGGGFVGYNYYGYIANCYATGDVYASTGSSYSYAGGFAGQSSGGMIENSFATGDAYAYSGYSTSSFCSYAGGFVASVSSTTITNCYEAIDQVITLENRNGGISNKRNYTTNIVFDCASIYFITDILTWDQTIWMCQDGSYPTLEQG